MNMRMTGMAMATYAIAILGAAGPTYADTATAATESLLAKSSPLNQTLATAEGPQLKVAMARGTSASTQQQHKAGERKWIALDHDAEPGAQARAVLDRDESNAQQSVLDIRIPGFWLVAKEGDDGRSYQKVVVPGLGSVDEIGAPDLPIFPLHLATPFAEDAAAVKVEPIKTRVLQGINVWPQPVPELDHEGASERFKRNDKIYASQRAWPIRLAEEKVAVGSALRNIPAIKAPIHTMQWNPASGELRAISHLRIHVSHPGEPREYKPITQERYRLAEKFFINWPVLEQVFKPNLLFYSSSYLFVYPAGEFRDELLPLIQAKKAKGFKVTELTVHGDIGTASCAAIRQAIIDWEAEVPKHHDAYALLVGDTDVIPHCNAPTGDQTDDLYASTNGDDLDEEIYLGRLSVDSEGDLDNQVTKILAYQNDPEPYCCYNRAVLWAHKENAPNKYVGAHEEVRTFPYASPPGFVTAYGSNSGVDDADVRGLVNNGVGVLAYRGHGSSSATATGWNLNNEYFQQSDVNLLSNLMARSPVVWSFACTNSRLDSNDAIGELWMENPESGASSYYGATRTSYTSQNHVLDKWMFRALYDEGLQTQSHAIQRAEAQMSALSGSTNAWMYLLLGDPDMQIRTENPFRLDIRIPELIRRCDFCELEFQVTDVEGRPLPNVLVGLWKQGETATNAYTDKEGKVSLDYQALTTGEMLLAVEDGLGNARLERIQVVK